MNKSQQEIDLYIKYQHAISNLDQGKIEEGKDQLRFLLRNSILKEKDSRGVLYGIYLSLAEILGRSESITDKCEALRYYHESNKIIENCWQTFRKMSHIFRQLGLIPRALNLTIKALQTCTQLYLQPSLLFQACCLCFLMNEQEQFEKYNKLLPNDDLMKKSIIELETYFNESKVTSFVRNLLNEQALIQHKLSQIPHQQFDQDFFQQQYDCELKINVTDLNKFFKKIKRIFQSNLNIDNEKLIVNLKDSSIFTKTSITVTTKMNQFSINPQTLLNGNKSAFTKYDKDQKSTTKQKDIQSIQPKFEQFVNKNYQPFLQSIQSRLKCDGIDFVKLTTFTEQAFGIRFDKEDTLLEKKENQIAKFLVEKLNQTRHLTILHLLNQIIILLYSEYQPRLKNQEKQLQEAQRKIIKCMIWAQFSIKEFSKDPLINIDILDTAIIELQYRLNYEKYQSVQQKIRIKNYQILIKRLKQQLMFETDIKTTITDQEIQQIYKKKYVRIMSLLHNDNSFLLDTQFELKNFQQKQVDLINKYRMQRTSKQSFEAIVGYWKKTNKKIEVTEKTLFQIQIFKELFSKDIQDLQKLFQIKQIMSAVIKQLMFSLNQREFKATLNILNPVFDSYFNLSYHDCQLGLISLKISFLNAYFESDLSKPLSHFIKICIPFTKYPWKQAFEIEVLKMPFLNYNNLFQYMDINLIMNDFVELRMKMQKKNTDMMNYFNNNFEEDHELMLYLLQFIKEKVGLFSDCVVQCKESKIQAKSTQNEIQELQEFSSGSENELENPNIFFKKYRDVNLDPEIIENKFKIISQYYEYSKSKKEFLLNHQIKINMGNPQIRKQMRKFTKEAIKQEIGFSMRKLRSEFLLKFFNDYYFSPDFRRTNIHDMELQFFAYYMPFCLDQQKDQKKCQDFFNQIIKPQIMPQINPTIIKYSDSIYQQFIQKQQQKQPTFNLTEQQDLIKNQNLFCPIRANLCFLLYRVNDKKDLKLLCLALAHNETLFFWDHLYMDLFQLASNQLNQKSQTSEAQDWFLSQKKVQVHLHKNPLMAHLFEYRFIMDLLKAQQRQIEYQSRPDGKSFQKVQQAYQYLLQQNQLQIPLDLFQLQYNFRAMLLIEKKIIRKYRNINIDRVKQNIENLIKLTALIKQMQQTQFKYYYNAYDCELEVIYDLYVNIYKFIKRFMRHKLYYQLNLLIGILLQQIPQLFTKNQQEYMQFVFPVDTKTYKLSQFTEEQLQAEYKTQYNRERLDIVLNNLYIFFKDMAAQLDKKKPNKFMIEALYYFVHIQYHNSRKEWILDQTYKHICQIYQLNSDEIIFYPKKLDNNCSENDEVLKTYFNHDLVYEYQKSKILKLIIKILFSQQKWQELIKLMQKLSKTQEVRIHQICAGLMNDYQKMDDPDLQRETLLKIHIQINSNPYMQQAFKDNQILAKMYMDFLDRDPSWNRQLSKDDDQNAKISQARQKLNMIWHQQNMQQQNQSELIIETEKVNNG